MFQWLKSLFSVQTIQTGVTGLIDYGRPVAKAITAAIEGMILVGQNVIGIILAAAAAEGLKLVL